MSKRKTIRHASLGRGLWKNRFKLQRIAEYGDFCYNEENKVLMGLSPNTISTANSKIRLKNFKSSSAYLSDKHRRFKNFSLEFENFRNESVFGDSPIMIFSMDMHIFSERRERALKINNELKKLFPHAKIALRYGNHWELLVSVVLSAQCTDKMVNKVTESLFKKYKTLDDYVNASKQEFEEDIRSAGFYKNKAKNILASARIIKEKYGEEIPNTMDELLTLPGVARKSANVILGNAFGIVEGIAVDTHVRRLSYKFGLTDNKDPSKIEKDLMGLLPKYDWFHFTYRLIEYGRQICPGRKHDCKNHPLTKFFPPAADRWIT